MAHLTPGKADACRGATNFSPYYPSFLVTKQCMATFVSVAWDVRILWRPGSNLGLGVGGFSPMFLLQLCHERGFSAHQPDRHLLRFLALKILLSTPERWALWSDPTSMICIVRQIFSGPAAIHLASLFLQASLCSPSDSCHYCRKN